jgi:hypothetical protein
MGQRTKKWAVVTALANVWQIAGCGAGGNDGQGIAEAPERPAPSNSSTGALQPSTGEPNTPTTGVLGPDFNVGDDSDSEIQPMGCQQAERSFVPVIPTVYLLVDRSGTMFDSLGGNVTAWTALRGGVLDVMRELESSVRFGFAAFSGANMGPLMCELQVPSVAPELNNYAAIAALYEPLGQPMNSKETPTVLALTEIAKQLEQDTATIGDKYILFVTDGEPDYCNDGNAICPPDSVVGLLQNLSSSVDVNGAARQPIRTLVFGVSSPTATIRQDVLQAFANAGAGLPVMALAPNANQAPDPNAVYDQCAGEPGWAVDFAATGKPAMRGQSIGAYVFDAATAGNAPVYRPDPTDQAALTEEIRVALAGVKSCTFDLGEDGVQVDLSRQDLGQLARVVINGTAVPFDPVNGWSMSSETTVALAGQACATWRTPTIQTSISFDFPCDVFVPR